MMPFRHYAVGMLITVAAALSWPSLVSAETVIARLSTDAPGARPIDIALKPDTVASPLAGKPQQGWVVHAGDALRAGAQPADRMIELYSGTTGSASLLCRIVVRYYAENGRWRPQFQLIEEPAFERTKDGWKPVMLPHGAPHLMTQTGSEMPNSEGFKGTLRFGLAGGPISIDAWRVR